MSSPGYEATVDIFMKNMGLILSTPDGYCYAFILWVFFYLEMCAYSIRLFGGGVFLCMKFQNSYMDYKMSPEPASTFEC